MDSARWSKTILSPFLFCEPFPNPIVGWNDGMGDGIGGSVKDWKETFCILFVDLLLVCIIFA